ncbi:response regulator [Persicobacter sp. CCB-QB2]|uniref:response regulator n=1 Tax=Persicobacter sp. CCB-QB2 TaxID=1561025 RepID=UPI00155DCDE0|nr:response regulator [Persicobacter sp. CCB-QB2]
MKNDTGQNGLINIHSGYPTAAVILNIPNAKILDYNKNALQYLSEEFTGILIQEILLHCQQNQIETDSPAVELALQLPQSKTLHPFRIFYQKISVEDCVVQFFPQKISNASLSLMPSQLETQLVSIIESTEDIIFSLDNQFCYTAFNRNHFLTMKKIYGLDIEIGKNVLEYMRVNGDHVKAESDIQRALDGESYSITQVYGNELYERTYFQANYNPIIMDGKVTGCAVFVKDISEEMRFQEQLKALNRDLQTQNEKLRELNHINSHKIRAKLSSIIGLSQLLLEDCPENENIQLLLQSANELDDQLHEMNDVLHQREQPVFEQASPLAVSNVWMIDDDPLHHKISTKMLELLDSGLKVKSFLRADEALEELQNSQSLPDIIFLDINMPYMSGWEFLEAFEERSFNIKIHMLSSSIDPDDENKASNFKPVSGFTSKPLSLERLKYLLSKKEE